MKYARLAERLFNRPLMISEPKLNVIQHYFSQHAGIELNSPGGINLIDVSESDRRRAGYSAKNGVGVIGIYGPLMHRVLAMEFPSGGPTTYSDIRRAFDLALADDAVLGIVLDMDSPGGEVSGVFDLADHIYQSRGIKPITAVINESAFSAAYLLASAAEKIIVPRTGAVGSIGVIATHADFSRMEEAAGLTVTHVYAGARKADFSQHQPLSDEARATLQEMVDDSYQLFVDTVARNRGLKKQAVIDTQAGIYDGKKAVEMKLADQVSAVDKAISTARQGKGTRLISATAATGAKQKENKMDEQELRENHPDLVAAIEGQARQGMITQEASETAKANAVTAATSQLMALVTSAVGEETAGRITMANSKGLTAEDLKTMGVSLSGETSGSGTKEKMLTAITEAAADGVAASGGKSDENQDRKQAVSQIAAAGSVR